MLHPDCHQYEIDICLMDDRIGHRTPQFNVKTDIFYIVFTAPVLNHITGSWTQIVVKRQRYNSGVIDTIREFFDYGSLDFGAPSSITLSFSVDMMEEDTLWLENVNGGTLFTGPSMYQFEMMVFKSSDN